MRAYVLAAVPVLALLGLAACQNDGSSQNQTLGQKLDNAGTQVRDAVDPPRGPAERLGRSIDRTVNPD